ncbi:CdaR family protein [Loigolactobacillus bifermentans]|uniref:YbbR family protein n=1 Tax=Loigolactobacillus bifermentans DSM 20003 TaxID=1423726 RepID=A0A0R1H8M2_9LACO|nr:CdaR family protein [Loigolactobacillus bifermentans]KRK40995.1 hypothetical protein FC07_GL001693 [Loigolactobacillus bifermentans DSM 20003]QGG59919.1 hypothetical protein LB003_05300 [Loigolactobacillus bifermentans]
MNRFFRSPWMYRILALLFAALLFMYVNIDQINSTRQATNTSTSMMANKTKTLTVPLQLNANTDKYFITGYPSKVKVNLEGPSALVTATSNTQNFKVIANLEKLGVGKHQVTLKMQGLNKEIGYRIKPSTISVNIQSKETKRFPIQVKFNKSNLKNGYTTGEPSLSQSSVVVTGARSQVSSIAEVVANVKTTNNISSSISQEVTLQALDQQGNTVNVLLDPATVHVTIPVMYPSKKVTLNLKPTGDNASDFSVSSETNTVTVTGAQTELDKLDTLTVSVPVSDVTSSTTKTVSVGADQPNLQVSPQTIRVSITPKSSKSASTSHASDSDTQTTQKQDESSDTATSDTSSAQSSSQSSDTTSSTESQSES